MPLTRDELEYESKRQQIMDGALLVFAKKGFEAASNKEIARAANIGSTGLIYHYFRDKEDLFKEVLERHAPAMQLILHGDELMDLPPSVVLKRFGEAFVQTLESPPALAMFRIALGEAVRRPPVAELVGRVGPVRGLALLSSYLSAQMDKGAMRRMDPGAAARCFVGPMIAYFLTQEVFIQPDSSALSAEKMIETLVEIFLRGMKPD